ncbi:hypothetical protein GCM10023094_41530 [Rhodococcus olei]|uniref:Uncharacterized protein n=1 Tax=Rhodococcus olei TaxID=2161675 RepID=A0ABP8PGU1_9NOCA
MQDGYIPRLAISTSGALRVNTQLKTFADGSTTDAEPTLPFRFTAVNHCLCSRPSNGDRAGILQSDDLTYSAPARST